MTLGTKKVFQTLNLQGHTLTGSDVASGTLTLLSTSATPKGKIIFGAGGITAFDEVNNRLGIGTAGPSVRLHTVDSGVGTALFVSTAAASGGAGSLPFAGSENPPTASGHRPAGFAMGVFASGTLRYGGLVACLSAESWTLGSAHGAHMGLHTVPVGSTTLTERLRIQADGTLNVPVTGVFAAAVGTAATNTSTGLEVNSTTKAFLNARMTTTQRDALTSVAGMQLYNSTTGQLERYDTAWAATGASVTQPTLGNVVQQLTSTATNDDPTEQVIQNRVATTDATVTTLHTFTIPASTTQFMHVWVLARRTGGSSGAAEDGAAYITYAAIKNVAGTATLITAGTQPHVALEDQAGWAMTLDVTGATARVRVTGATNNNITWHMTARVYSVST